MMTTREPIHQIIFGFTDAGLGVVDQSIQHDTLVWHDRLSRVARLSPVQLSTGAYVPPFAFTYLEYGDQQAMLLRRANTGGQGRNNSHALVASINRLRPLSLSLRDWNGWQDQPSYEPVGPITESLHEVSVRWQESMLCEVDTHRLHVTKILRRLVEEPERRLSVLPAEEGTVLPLLWMCRQVLEPLFGPSTSPFRWTFSTFEETDADEHPHVPAVPRVVFLPETPPAGGTSRDRVFLNDPQPCDSSWELAESIVDSYLRDPRNWATSTRYRLRQEQDIHRRLASFRNGSSGLSTWQTRHTGATAVARTVVAQPDQEGRDLELSHGYRDQWSGLDEQTVRSTVTPQEIDHSSLTMEQVLWWLEKDELAPGERRALTGRLRELLAEQQKPAEQQKDVFAGELATGLWELEWKMRIYALAVITVLLLAQIIF